MELGTPPKPKKVLRVSGTRHLISALTNVQERRGTMWLDLAALSLATTIWFSVLVLAMEF
jgi:hypothetical protein